MILVDNNKTFVLGIKTYKIYSEKLFKVTKNQKVTKNKCILSGPCSIIDEIKRALQTTNSRKATRADQILNCSKDIKVVRKTR